MSLNRALNLRDLVLLLVVAVVNVNILPVMAAEGWRALTLWILAFFLFLLPQAIAVAEFGTQYPQEGGIYLWTREMFGEFHAFLSGWCYWTNNLFYVPSVLFILIGVATYAGGPDSVRLAENPHFMAIVSISCLWLVTGMHIRGLGVGKWLNNLGGIGVWISLTILLIIGYLVVSRTGNPATPFEPSQLIPSLKDYGVLSAFSLAMYSLVGLELGSVMGDEIKNTRQIIRKAVFLGGAISIFLYVLGTAALLAAVPSDQVGAIQGLMQAVSIVASSMQLSSIVPLIAVLISFAVLGICSAWLAGSARIPFVMGLEVYLPPVLGKTHPRWNSPHIALLVQGIISTVLILISLYGSNVRDAYGVLLSSSIVIQLIPFVYLFLGLFKLGKARLVAMLGAIATSFGIIFVFVPASAVKDVWAFEAKVIAGTVFMLGSAVVFYLIGRRKQISRKGAQAIS
jgi:amino acid transporter